MIGDNGLICESFILIYSVVCCENNNVLSIWVYWSDVICDFLKEMDYSGWCVLIM